MGGLQWLALLSIFRGRGWWRLAASLLWVPANGLALAIAAAGLIFAMLFRYIAGIYLGGMIEIAIGLLILFLPVYAAITGLVLVWLIKSQNGLNPALDFERELAGRIRKLLGRPAGLTEKETASGLTFRLNGNLFCGVYGRELVVRLDPGQAELALKQPYTRIVEQSGQALKGWILVQPEGLASEAVLAKWIQAGWKYTAALPAK